MRARIWDAFFLSPRDNTDRKSSANRCPSSVRRTSTPGAMDSNDTALRIPKRGEMRRTVRWLCSDSESLALIGCVTSSFCATELVICTDEKQCVFIYTRQLFSIWKPVYLLTH